MIVMIVMIAIIDMIVMLMKNKYYIYGDILHDNGNKYYIIIHNIYYTSPIIIFLFSFLGIYLKEGFNSFILLSSISISLG